MLPAAGPAPAHGGPFNLPLSSALSRDRCELAVIRNARVSFSCVASRHTPLGTGL